jgi:hypothetical protein
MLQITYSSLACYEFSKAELVGMLNEFRKYNARREITGILFYSRGRFLQLLEGEQIEVLQLFQKISQDLRHRDVCILDVKLPRRMFPDWSMAFHDLTLADEKYLKIDPGVDLHLIDVHTVLEMCSFVSENLPTIQTRPASPVG